MGTDTDYLVRSRGYWVSEGQSKESHLADRFDWLVVGEHEFARVYIVRIANLYSIREYFATYRSSLDILSARYGGCPWEN